MPEGHHSLHLAWATQHMVAHSACDHNPGVNQKVTRSGTIVQGRGISGGGRKGKMYNLVIKVYESMCTRPTSYQIC